MVLCVSHSDQREESYDKFVAVPNRMSLVISKYNESEIYREKILWDSEGDFQIGGDEGVGFSVFKGDKISIRLEVDSPINIQNVEWGVDRDGDGIREEFPLLFYISGEQEYTSTPEDLNQFPDNGDEEASFDDLKDLASSNDQGDDAKTKSLVIKDAGGNYTYQFPVSHSIDIYSNKKSSEIYYPWNAPKSGKVFITPWITYDIRSKCKVFYGKNICHDDGYVIPDENLIFTIKKRDQLVSKQFINAREFISSPETVGYKYLSMIQAEEGEELYFSVTTSDEVLARYIGSVNLKFSYASNKLWSVPVSDQVTLYADFKNSQTYPYSVNDYDEEGYERPVKINERHMAYIIRKGDVIISQKVFELPVYKRSSSDNNGFVTYDDGGHKVNIDLPESVKNGDELYFDLISVDEYYTDLSVKQVRGVYQSGESWISQKDGVALISPELEFVPEITQDGAFTLVVLENGRKLSTFNYLIADGNVREEDKLPKLIPVRNGYNYTFYYFTSDYSLSSYLQDTGRILLGHIDEKVGLPSVSIFSDNLQVDLSAKIKLSPSTPNDLSGVMEIVLYENNNIFRRVDVTINQGVVENADELTNIPIDYNANANLAVITKDASLLNYVDEVNVDVRYHYSTDESNNNIIESSHNLKLNVQDITIGSTALNIAMPLQYQKQLTSLPQELYWPSSDPLLGSAYRGWTYFAYNANDRDQVPINESLMVFSDKEEDYTKDKKKNVYPAIGDLAASQWLSSDIDWRIDSMYMTSSRKGLNYTIMPDPADFEPPQVVPAGVAPAYRYPNISVSDQDTNSIGFGLTVNLGDGYASDISTLRDLNGDRYPDVVTNQSVIFTNGQGSLDFSVGSGAPISSTSNENLTFSVGPAPQLNPSEALGAAKAAMAAKKSTDDPKKIESWSAGASDGASKNLTSLIDMNGDGLPDRVAVSGTKLLVSLNRGYEFYDPIDWGVGKLGTSDSTSISIGGTLGYGDSAAAFTGGLNLSRSNNYAKHRLMDFTGDGLPDYVYASGANIYVHVNKGNGFATSRLTFTGALPTYNINPLDLSEFINYGKVFLSDGASTSLTASINASFSLTLIPIFPAVDLSFTHGRNEGWTVSRPTIAYTDVNGDGYIDSVRSRNGKSMSVGLNKTGRINLLKSVSRPLGSSFTLDYKRDGNSYDLPQSRWNLSSIEIYDGHEGDGITDHQKQSFEYQEGYHDRWEREFYGYKTVIERLHDTDTTDASDPVYRQTISTYYNDNYYTKGLLDRQESWGATVASNTESGITFDSSLKLLQATEQDYKLHEVLSDSDYVNIAYDKGGVVVFPQQVKSSQIFYEPQNHGGSKSTYTEHKYDAYGNVIEFIDAGDDASKIDDVRAEITYTAANDSCLANYIVGKPESIQVYGKHYNTEGELQGEAQLRHREAVFDCEKGNLKEVHQYHNGSAISTSVDYDTYGNLKKVTGPANNKGDQYSREYEYDDLLVTHVSKISDSFGYTSRAEYNYLFGKPAFTVDTNGNHMETCYDSVGRVSAIYGPEEAGKSRLCGDTVESDQLSGTPTIAFEYQPNPVSGVPYAVTRHLDKYRPGDTINTVLFIDGLQRVLQTKKDASINGEPGRTVSGQVIYDAFGRTIEQYYPSAELGAGGLTKLAAQPADQLSTKTFYDSMDRSVRIELPADDKLGELVTRTDYSFGYDRNGSSSGLRFETRVTDAKGKSKVTYKDGRQLITSVKEFLDGDTLWTSYEYDALKQIVQVRDTGNAANEYGNITRVAYDDLGRRTHIDNPDMGLVEMRYDDAGNLIEKVTPNLRAQEKAIEYDYHYSRLEGIRYPNYPDNNITYVYGDDSPETQAKNQVGRIVSISHQAGVESYEYGKLGERVKETKQIDVGPHVQQFVTGYEYDAWGRLHGLSYPDGEQLTYTYDAGGNLFSAYSDIDGERVDYLKRLEYDAFEQRTLMEQGNGIVTNYTYDAQTRRLEHLIFGVRVKIDKTLGH